MFFAIFAKDYPLRTIISSYALHSGIGYVWIIRIYLLTALVLPIWYSVIKKNEKFSYIIISILYFLYEFAAYKNIFNFNIVFSDFLAWIVPLMLIITVTHWVMKSNNKSVITFSIVNLIVFIGLAYLFYRLTGDIKTTNYMKYPFRLYYLSYGFAASGIWIVLCRQEKFVNMVYTKVLGFISSATLWIYLWHILGIVVLNKCFNELFWIWKFLLVTVFAVAITYLQNKIVDCFKSKEKIYKYLMCFKG